MSARVILVHGAFHGSWCWAPVVEGLRALGIEAVAVDLPGPGAGGGAGLAEHARVVRAEIAAGDPPVVLCGHSYGGAVITEAVDPAHPADHLVYLAAAVPARGESMVGCLPEVLDAAIAHASRPHDGADGAITIDPERARAIFYHDCTAEAALDAVSMLVPHASESLTDLALHAAWQHTATTYVVCDDDRAIPPHAQERMAKRCRHRVSWPTSHSPMLSRPELVVSLLSEIALAV